MKMIYGQICTWKVVENELLDSRNTLVFRVFQSYKVLENVAEMSVCTLYFQKLDPCGDTHEHFVSTMMIHCYKFEHVPLSLPPGKISVVTDIGCWMCCLCDDSSKRSTASKQRQKKKESKVKRFVAEY